jgi:tetratricopeptide (TPR) repeat protein
MSDLLELGRVDHLARLVALCVSTFGEPSREVVAARHHLALAHICAGEHSTAAELLQDAIGCYYLHAMQHPCLLASMHVALGVALHRQERLEGAEECYLHAIDIVQEHLGRDDPATSSVHANLGILSLAMGRLEPAKRSFSRALKLAQCIMGWRQLKVAALHRCLAECHAREASWAEALQSDTHALKIYERRCGSGDDRTIAARVEVARAHMRLKDPTRALGQLLKARAACAAHGRHDSTLPVAKMLASAYSALGRHAEAASQLSAAGADDAEASQMLEALRALEESANSW